MNNSGSTVTYLTGTFGILPYTNTAPISALCQITSVTDPLNFGMDPDSDPVPALFVSDFQVM